MARYDSVRKINRNKMIIQFREDNPELSLKEIAESFNVSRQRVFQILKRYGNDSKKVG